MSKFAAHDDVSIYAVADSPHETIAKARLDAMDPGGEFQTARLTAELAAWIEENGWHGSSRSFAIRDGFLVDTTDE